MPRSSDGEFELVLGNKQLLSLFFLVVVLFAVFFSLGYMVGKSVSPVVSIAAQPANAPAATAAPAAAPPTLPEPVKEMPSVGAPAVEQPSAAPPIETQPARIETTPASAPATAPAAISPASATKAVAPGVAANGNPVTSAPAPAGDIHLQVAAVRVKADAQALTDVLRRKGYAATLNEDAGDGWYRVLVGPFASDKDAQETKARLETDGYRSMLKKP